jgi:hypothetical protein
VGKSPQIVHINFNQTRFARPANNSVIQRSAKEVGKNRENVD